MLIKYQTALFFLLTNLSVYLLSICLAPVNTYAQGQSKQELTEEELARYKVEVIIFKRNFIEPYADSEHWRKDIILAYPTNRKLLQSSKTQDDDNALANEDQPYLIALPKEQRELKESAAAINRKSNMTVLFHEIWEQDLKNTEDAPGLMLESGKRFGDKVELNGWIKISIARYLHIQTDLWLADYVPNSGQLLDFWPTIPTILIETSEEIPAAAELVTQQNQFTNGRNNGSFGVTGFSATNNFLNSNQSFQPFLVDTIYTLKQKRRMRSGELHYLDHPKLGLIIKLNAVEPE